MDSSNVALGKLSKWKKDRTVLWLTKETPEGKELLRIRGIVGYVDEANGVANFEAEHPVRGIEPLPDLHDAEFVVAEELMEILFPDGTRFVLEKVD